MNVNALLCESRSCLPKWFAANSSAGHILPDSSLLPIAAIPLPMALIIVRCAFIFVAAGVAVSLFSRIPDKPPWLVWAFFFGVIAFALGIIATDIAVRKKRIDTISAVYFGLLVGLLLTYVLGIALTPIMAGSEFKDWGQVAMGTVLSYLCISFLIQTKDDFRFVIPYVEFVKDVKGLKPYILDTSAVIDGRIADVVDTHILDNPLFMPRFVLSELQNIADSSDKLRRTRGRRGLDILNRLRSAKNVDFQIHDRELAEMVGQEVDMKLVLLARHLDGKLVTGDYNLNKIARLHNVPVINLNDLSNALKPLFLPGERVQVRLVKEGEEDGQGIGYLEDGTMIVVENGRAYINKDVRIGVTSVLQTSAGRMIFGRFEALATED